MIGALELQNNLQQFTGTEMYHKFGPYRLTDGVKYLAEAAQCYWLFDIIHSYHRNLKSEPFVIIMLSKKEDDSFEFGAYRDYDSDLSEEDNSHDLIISQFIEFSDFPLDEIKLYIIDGVILLPSEY
jgi:hypothetical protein